MPTRDKERARQANRRSYYRCKAQTRPLLTRESLATQVSDILNFSRSRAQGYHDMRTGPAAKIVNAIIKAMTSAILRGERVTIEGFGIFSIRTKKQTKSYCMYFYGGKGRSGILRTIPEKRYVHFEPSKVLKRMLNNEEPNGT